MDKISNFARYCNKAVGLIFKGNFRKLFHRIREKIEPPIMRIIYHNSIVLGAVEIIITENCTLRCKNCANLMQYYPHPKNIGVAQILSNIDLLMKHVDYVCAFRVIGGEPMVVKQLPEILAHLQKYKKRFSVLLLTTNGTIVPSEQTLLALKKAGTLVNISNYGEKSSNLDKLVARLKEYRINCDIINVVWRHFQQVVTCPARSEETVDDVFRKCQATCNSLLNGKLYRCPFLAHGDNLRLFPPDERNYLDLTDKTLSKEDIRLWQSKKFTPPGCRFCSGYSLDLPVIPVAEQINEPIPYHRFDD